MYTYTFTPNTIFVPNKSITCEAYEKDEITLKEYEKTKKRIAELEMENEILKKLPPYSQENDRRNRYLQRKVKANQ